MDGEIKVESGVSWLHDKLVQELEDRGEALKEGMARGVPVEEYKQFVGRYRENREIRFMVTEIFEGFYQDDDDTGDELGDLDEA